MFFIFSEFSSKEPIKLYAKVDRSPEQIIALWCEPRFVGYIVSLIHGSTVTTSSNEVDNSM